MTAIEALQARRLTREPMAHILGEREFWGLPFRVSKDTLIPRPDSEILVEAVLDPITDREAPLRLVDIGTGSGCLLLALLSELPNSFGIGIDLSWAALEIARENAERLGFARRCAFVQGDFGAALGGSIDILISNPPYLAQEEVSGLARDVAAYEPHAALVSGQSGLEAYAQIFAECAALERRPGLMAFEIGYRQALPVSDLANTCGLTGSNGAQGKILKDLSGNDRVFLLGFSS